MVNFGMSSGAKNTNSHTESIVYAAQPSMPSYDSMNDDNEIHVKKLPFPPPPHLALRHLPS